MQCKGPLTSNVKLPVKKWLPWEVMVFPLHGTKNAHDGHRHSDVKCKRICSLNKLIICSTKLQMVSMADPRGLVLGCPTRTNFHVIFDIKIAK